MKSLISDSHLASNPDTSLKELAASLTAKIFNACKSAGAVVANELATRRALAELQSLDDHMLKDIGMTRCSIEAIVRGKIDESYGRN